MTVVKHLARAGVVLRNKSEAESLKWAGKTLVQRRQQTRGAYESVRGRVRSDAELCLAATTRFSNQSGIVRREQEIGDQLRTLVRGVSYQHPVGPYNVDLAIKRRRIAVEIQRGDAHRSKSLRCERLEHILSEGWCLLICYCAGGEFDATAVANTIHAVAKRASLDPSVYGCYGVIGRHGEFRTALRDDHKHFPTIESS